jgi:tetratricopeptide (TPR) repeat protein
VGPKLLYPLTKTINHAGYVFNAQLETFYPIYHEFDAEFHGVTKEREFQALLGACLVVKRSAFFAAGMFSDYGLEDIDLCLKVRQQGLKVVYNPLSTVLHFGSLTLRESPPGTLPQTTTHGFNARWPLGSLESDDERFYREDGFSLQRSEDRKFGLSENISESCACVKQASRLAETATPQIEALLKLALSLHPHNVAALRQLLELYRRLRRYLEALKCAEILRQVEPGNPKAYLTLIELCLQADEKEYAARMLDYLSLFPQLPGEVRERISELKRETTG